MNKTLVTLIFLLFYPITSSAATYCIDPSKSYNGDGLSWGSAINTGQSGAYNAIPTTLERGSTYYLADGIYGNVTFSSANSGDLSITIKKAIESEHGPSAGWEPSMGDGQAIFDKISITTSYWTLDGAKRDTISSGYGIKLASTGTNNNAITISSGAVHHIIRYVEIDRGGQLESEVEKNGIYGVPNVSNLIVSHCYIHDFQGNGVTVYGADNIFEYCYFLRSFGYGDVHSQAFQLFSGLNGATSYQEDTTIRNNIFEDIKGTAVVSMAGTLDGVYIYGNIFKTTSNSLVYTSRTIFDISNGTNEPGIDNLLVYNNTWFEYPDKPNITGDRAGVMIYSSPNPSTNHVYNNYFYNCVGIHLDEVNANHDYNYFNNSTISSTSLQSHEISNTILDPFLDPSAYNFRLKSKGPIGISLSAPYSPVDPSMAVRGRDGDWDIGAYEYLIFKDHGSPHSMANKPSS